MLNDVLYLTVYFINKLFTQKWGHLFDLPLLTHSFHTMKILAKQLSARIQTTFLPTLCRSETQNKFTFLHVEVICEQDKLTTIIYRKTTFIRVYSIFESFSPSVCKSGMVFQIYDIHLSLSMFLYLFGVEEIPYRVNFLEEDVS